MPQMSARHYRSPRFEVLPQRLRYGSPERGRSFQWRGRLGFALAGLAELLLFTLLLAPLIVATATVRGWFWHWSLWAAFATGLWRGWRWCGSSGTREPKFPLTRKLVSSADGKVTHIEEVDDPDFPGGGPASAFSCRCSTSMSTVCRVMGITSLRYFPGRSLTPAMPNVPSATKLWIDLEESNPPRLVRDQADLARITRRIVCWLSSARKSRKETAWA